jgi:hypothetical protein
MKVVYGKTTSIIVGTNPRSTIQNPPHATLIIPNTGVNSGRIAASPSCCAGAGFSKIPGWTILECGTNMWGQVKVHRKKYRKCHDVR